MFTFILVLVMWGDGRAVVIERFDSLEVCQKVGETVFELNWNEGGRFRCLMFRANQPQQEEK